MIRKPAASDLYGYYEEPNKMPAFGPEQLTTSDVEMVVRFLKNDYLPPRGPATPAAGKPAGGFPKATILACLRVRFDPCPHTKIGRS